MRIRANLLSLLVVAFACDGEAPTTVPLPEETLAIADIDVGFHDSPLVGELHVQPLDANRSLHFSVDLGADGEIDEAGPLGLGIRVGYRFERPGAHEIVTVVQSEDAQQTFRRIVVVNDADRTARLHTFDTNRGSHGLIGALEATSDGRLVFLLHPSLQIIAAHSGEDMSLLWEIRSIGFPQSLALSPNDEILYVGAAGSVIAVRVAGEPQILGRVGPYLRGIDGGDLVTLPDGTLLNGAPQGLVRLDPRTGSVLARYENNVGPFGVSADGAYVAFVSHPFDVPHPRPDVAVLLRTSDLSEVWSVELTDRASWRTVAAPSPGGDHVYALLSDPGSFRTFLYVVSGPDDGGIRHRLPVFPMGPSGNDLAWDTAATTPDGRYVALANERAVHLIDTNTHLPVARFPDGVCCLMAGVRGRDTFFTAHFSELVEVEVLR